MPPCPQMASLWMEWLWLSRKTKPELSIRGLLIPLGQLFTVPHWLLGSLSEIPRFAAYSSSSHLKVGIASWCFGFAQHCLLHRRHSCQSCILIKENRVLLVPTCSWSLTRMMHFMSAWSRSCSLAGNLYQDDLHLRSIVFYTIARDVMWPAFSYDMLTMTRMWV